MAIIAFLTDFGTRDSYVAQMKGVALSIAPSTTLVDITHEVPKFQISRGAEILSEAEKTFPAQTIFVAVVDPGVGGERRRIIVEGEDKKFFVGPDNGLLTSFARYAWEIENLIPASKTFEGRDVFTPVAAMLANGHCPEEFGRPIDLSRLAPSQLILPKKLEHGVEGKIVFFDDFGNALTNLEVRETLSGFQIFLAERQVATANVYEEIPPGEVRALVSSSQRLEFAANKGSAREQLHLQVGMSVRVERA